MDVDSNDLEHNLSQTSIDTNANGSNIFLPVWLRSFVQKVDGLDRFLLDYGFNILPNIGFIIYMLFLLF
jgi:hypothetical protein